MGQRAVFFFREAVYEARQGFMSLITPLVFFGLTAFMLILLLNADNMRSLGAVDVYRNSPHVVYLMVSGQCLWLFFAWAWLFAQIVARDRSAQLHEVVLACPVSLPWLIAARFTGALAVAIFLGSSICVGLLMAPLLVTFGALPPEAVGPVPWEAAAWSLVVFTIPSAFATGLLFLVAASWTRSSTGAFAAAALLALVWMTSLVVLREGDVAPMLASIIDPSGFAEMERQSLSWTPAEKKVAMIGFTDVLLLNRGLWLLLGAALGAGLLLRLRREHLALERAPRSETPKLASTATQPTPPVGPIVATHWWQAFVAECAWHLKISLQGFGLRLALLLLTVMGAVGSWVNVVQHIDGPLVPTPEAQLHFLTGFYFVILLFVVLGFAGALMRRDDHNGFVEWLDASPMPLGIRLLARFCAALGLIILLCLVPAVASLLVTGLGAPQSLDALYPFASVLLTLFPAFAELCAVTVLAHAVFQRAGTAYIVSILVAFVAIINHDLELVQYPPAEVINPIHAYPSELTGWTPWMPMIATLLGWKLTLVLLVFAASWIAWRRGTALTLRERLAAARVRAFGSAGLTVAVACVMLALLASLLSTEFVDEGGYQSTGDALRSDGQWEKDWWSQASPFSLRGGDVAVRLKPGAGIGEVRWRIDGLRASRLQGTLPHGILLVGAQRDGTPANLKIDGDHFVVDAGCEAPCTLTLELAVEAQGWPTEAVPWLDASGVWLRAQNVLPTLGHDPERLVRSIGDRAGLGLAAELPPLPTAAALRSLEGVAPLGSWSWSVAVDEGMGNYAVVDHGKVDGVLAFASVWLPEGLPEQQRLSTRFLVGEARLTLLDKFAEDLVALRQCIAEQFGDAPAIKTVLQAPRKTGNINLYDGVLWAPEDIAWQSDGTGSGGWQRQYNIATAIARNVISARSDLRDEAGARWLLEGTAGWAALGCVEDRSGFKAAIALRKQAAERIAEIFATTDKPVTKVVDADKSWLGHYAALSLDSWGAAESRLPGSMLEVLDANTASTALLSRLALNIGPDALKALLGAPRSSDVSILHNDAGDVTTVLSWVWKAGGWQEQQAEDRLLVRGPHLSAQDYAPAVLTKLGAELDGAYLFHAGYGYERSLDDNRLQDE